MNFLKKQKRPGRDLNPGQKLRRLLGCPLPHRDTHETYGFLLTCLDSHAQRKVLIRDPAAARPKRKGRA
jgi:hypothetical protein